MFFSLTYPQHQFPRLLVQIWNLDIIFLNITHLRKYIINFTWISNFASFTLVLHLSIIEDKYVHPCLYHYIFSYWFTYIRFNIVKAILLFSFHFEILFHLSLLLPVGICIHCNFKNDFLNFCRKIQLYNFVSLLVITFKVTILVKTFYS